MEPLGRPCLSAISLKFVLNDKWTALKSGNVRRWLGPRQTELPALFSLWGSSVLFSFWHAGSARERQRGSFPCCFRRLHPFSTHFSPSQTLATHAETIFFLHLQHKTFFSALKQLLQVPARFPGTCSVTTRCQTFETATSHGQNSLVIIYVDVSCSAALCVPGASEGSSLLTLVTLIAAEQRIRRFLCRLSTETSDQW